MGQADRVTPSPGKLQDKYIVGKVMGYGSFGEIRKVKDTRVNIMYCVKVMAKRLMQAKQIKRVYYEIELLKRFDHPNIVKVLDYYETSEKIYIVQELCTGGELYAMVKARKNSRFEEHEVATILQQICQAVNYLHQNRVVHRDIKFENIVFCNQENLKLMIIDFGTAQRFIPGTNMTQPFGTPNYMAPEVIKGCYTEKCDMWAIGVVAYAMLVGQMPFQGLNDIDLLRKISQFSRLTLDSPELRERSIGSIDFMRKLFHVDQMQRPSAEMMIDHQWIRSLGEYTVDRDTIKKSLECFRNYKAVGPLQKKVIEFITVRLFSDKEGDHYRKIFYTINRTADGMCTKDQFIKAFWSLGFTEMSEHELDSLLAYIDDDKNGFVTYQEFLVASVHSDDILTPTKLLSAFKSFDQDNSGSISIQEFKDIVDKEGDIIDSQWDAIFAEVDDDGSGEINIEEFSEMMQKIFLR